MLDGVNPEEAKWIETILHLDPLEGDDLEKLVQELGIDKKAFDFDGWPNCSKPRVGEFGGWWLAISATGVEGGNSWDAVREAAEKLEHPS
jgi:hypothetical protein